MRRSLWTALPILASALTALTLVPPAQAATPAPTMRGAHAAGKVAASDSYYELVNFNSDKCLGVSNGNMSDGSPLVQYHCDGTLNQKWTDLSVADGFSEIRNKADHTKCLGVPGGSNDPGAQLVVWTCNGHLDQRWKFETVYDFWTGFPLGENLLNRNSGQCIGVAGGNTHDAAAVVQWRCDGTDNQIWS